MKPNAETFSTVISGQWNPSIFTPNWARKYLVTESGIVNVEIAFPLGDASLPPRINFEDIFIYPHTNRLDISAHDSTKDNLIKTTLIAKKCIELLAHTPISGVGINLSFYEDTAEAGDLLNLFSFDDNAQIDSQQLTLKSSSINRSFKRNEQGDLNISISHDNDKILVDFNFHFSVGNAEQALEYLNQNTVELLYDEATAFISNTYGLIIEEN